ncbi:MAG: DUF1015 domain-containing protein [Candidatus Rokuibacteriota bacterium]|jgi:uncharacterized protein (DUF1015 family)
MRIEAFRGYRFGIDRGRNVSEVVAPPYDQISPEIQDRLYAMHPNNIVRVSYPRDQAGPGETADKYRRAAETLHQWLRERCWAQDDRNAIYPYTQTYQVGGREVTRSGFIALGEVSDYARGIVLPHERTHAGPKRDRMSLLEQTGADIGLLFMLVADPAGRLRAATTGPGEPIAEATDLRGERHRLWRLTDPDMVGQVTALMAEATVIIADGHHRYETAVAYAARHPEARHKMMAFFTLEAPGLTIFPNHRLVHDVIGFTLPTFLEHARRWFDVSPLADPLAFTPTAERLGVVAASEAVTLALRPDAVADISWPADTSAAWRRLAVSILHEGLLKPLLGIDDAKLDARTNVDYTADQAEAVRWAREGRYQAAFLIAPTTPEELQAVVRGGEVLPQKSTHFYPKLLDGLVFHLLR